MPATPAHTRMAIDRFHTQRQSILKLRDNVKIATDGQAAKLEVFCDVLDKDISGLGGDVLAVREMSQAAIVFDPKAKLEEVGELSRLQNKTEPLLARIPPPTRSLAPCPLLACHLPLARTHALACLLARLNTSVMTPSTSAFYLSMVNLCSS